MDPEKFDRVMLEAIAEEVAARDFYGRVAQQVKDPNVAAMFEQFSKDENEHSDHAGDVSFQSARAGRVRARPGLSGGGTGARGRPFAST